MTGRQLAPLCRTLGISRACAYRDSVGRPARYVRADDRVVTAQIRTVIRMRASYGARRVRALVNREFAAGYNLKRIQPSRPARRSAFSHPSSTAAPSSW